MRLYEVNVRFCGKLKVYVQGERRVGKIGFLTVHDVGSNYDRFVPFVETPAMSEVAKKSVWIHICLPGQDYGDANLPENYEFPTMDEIADDLLSILDQHGVPSVIGFGHGAGANVLCRFGLKYPNRCTGLILIDCNCTAVSFDEKLHRTMLNVKGGKNKVVGKLKSLIAKQNNVEENDETVNNVSKELNQVNVLKYLQSYMKRNDISAKLTTDLKCNVVLVTGDKSKHLESVRSMNNSNVSKTLLVILEQAADALLDSPTELARAVILFCKGCGVLIGVPIMGLEREFKQITQRKTPSAAQIQYLRQIQKYEDMNNESSHI